MDRPPHSMTGVGFAAGTTEVGELRIEVRAVNGRSLVQKLRLPAVCAGFEAAVEDQVRQRLQRGTVTVVVERQAAASVLPDRTSLRAGAAELQQLARELGLPPPGIAEVLQLVLASGRGEATTSRPLPPRFQALLAGALDDLQRHRQVDGLATCRAISAQLAEFEGHLATAEARAPQLASVYRERLLQRVQEFAQAHLAEPVPALDLVREVAIYADRIDVAEELQRLRAHLAEVRLVLSRGGEVGRRLEFLLQELLRETNTLGAKSPDTSLSHTVVSMKSCVDRLKEQVANLE